MQKVISLHGKNIPYTLKINKRTKGVKMSIHPGGICIVTVRSKRIPQILIERFMREKEDWIIEKIRKMAQYKDTRVGAKEEYKKYKEVALKIAEERLKYFNQFYNFRWNRITIRNQKTRWGSCSKRGNLSFNYKIALLESKAVDYIVVHELCHLKEFNHSTRFWNLVAQTVPEYLSIRKDLRKNKLRID